MSDTAPEGAYVGLVADAETFGQVENYFGVLLAACDAELAALPSEMTTSLPELVALQREGLVIAAARQAATQPHN